MGSTLANREWSKVRVGPGAPARIGSFAAAWSEVPLARPLVDMSAVKMVVVTDYTVVAFDVRCEL